MTIVIHGLIQSTRTQRVLLLCHELELHFELKNVEMMEGEHKTEKFVKDFHPFGRLPVVDDEGVRLFESRAICSYLVAKYAPTESPFRHPADAASLGVFEQMASVEYSYFDTAMSKLAYEKIFKKSMRNEDPDPREVNAAYELVTASLDLYEKHLRTTAFLSGKNVGVLDIYTAPWINFLGLLAMNDEVSSRPKLNQWWRSMTKRSSWEKLAALLPSS